MKQLSNLICFVIITIFSMAYLCAMNKESALMVSLSEEDVVYREDEVGMKYISPDEYEQYKQHALQAESYNLNHWLFLLPKELLNYLFLWCYSYKENQVESLIDSMKNFMNLRMVCKKYNALLTFQDIGDLCKCYAQENKNFALKKCIERTDYMNYKSMCAPFLILLSAGADANTKGYDKTLIYIAVFENDVDFVRLLFQYNADPNVFDENKRDPVLFSIKHVEIAEMFLAQKSFNVHAAGKYASNVLWHIMNDDEYPAELVKLYLANNVEAKRFGVLTKNCLLHEFVVCYNIQDVVNHLKKGKFLLDVISDMINALNVDEKTPLDFAESLFKKAQENQCDIKPQVVGKFIALFRQYGALTAAELKQQAILQRQRAQKNKPNDCVIF